jgi:hypothetical protein
MTVVWSGAFQESGNPAIEAETTVTLTNTPWQGICYFKKAPGLQPLFLANWLKNSLLNSQLPSQNPMIKRRAIFSGETISRLIDVKNNPQVRPLHP